MAATKSAGGAELLAPAGDFETALAAFAAGADAVYLGLSDYSARAFAKNFTFEELSNLIAYARSLHPRRKVYVTFNTLVDEDSLEDAAGILARLEEIGPDALIVQDIGIAALCREHFPKLELHASTQLVAHNLEGVLALGEMGFTRVVLARELSLEEIVSIAKRCGKIELECFIHGALCYSLSGLCLYGAMEKDRSGNRGRCPYCCRMPHDGVYPFSMKDLRLGADVRRLIDAGVVSLKVEGRMKSPLYVASVVKYYRSLIDGVPGEITLSDLETVFSRRTTKLYFDASRRSGADVSAVNPVDSSSLGHLGTPIGRVKRITKDREGRSWIRFHTSRALERHDGLQFDTMVDGRHIGIGIGEMRQAISRVNVFEVEAGCDVEIEIPEDFPVRSGETVYCSMSNAVKRMFPKVPFRPSDLRRGTEVGVAVAISADRVTASADGVECSIEGVFDFAKNPERTFDAVKKAFSKTGGSGFCVRGVSLADPEGRFVPMSELNDLRRDLLERLEDEYDRRRREKVDRALACAAEGPGIARPVRTVKIRAGEKLPAGTWDEVVVAVNAGTEAAAVATLDHPCLRLALPVYNPELSFNALRSAVKRLLRAGFRRWEASDLATLRLLRSLGVEDITADWTLYAFNSRALSYLAGMGVGRFVASPENSRENLQYLAESGFHVEFLGQQSTPLFISLTPPAGEVQGLAVFERDGLYVTARPVPRTFETPPGHPGRIDLSWNAI
jgi:putative protease